MSSSRYSTSIASSEGRPRICPVWKSTLVNNDGDAKDSLDNMDRYLMIIMLGSRLALPAR